MPKLKNIFLHLLIMSLFVGFVLAIRFKPITQSLELDYDEGLNLIKAFLYGQGFSLYTQIWNDQPPLFTVILSQWFHLFGQSIFAARFLIMLFSALLIWCFYQIINSELGKIPAFVATLILFTSGLFIRLSISVMIGIPSLSLAMLSIYFLNIYKKQYRQPFLIWSGGLLALSLLRVPPEMAVISYKRLNSGNLTSKQLLTILENYCPEQMVLGRWISQIKSDSDLMAYVNENYSKIYTDEKNTVEHYLLNKVHKCTPKHSLE